MAGTMLQCDFTSGELSPALLARVDLAKYAKGCRTERNFISRAQGGAAKRPGFEFLGEVPGDAVLVPFVFNTEQAYCLVFGNKWMRVAQHDGFVLQNGSPYQIATPYTLEQAKRMSYTQSADVLFIACHGVAPQKLQRYGHTDWRWEEMDFSAPFDAPTWGEGTSERKGVGYELTYPIGTAFLMEREEIGHSGGEGNAPEYQYTYVSVNEDLYTEIAGAAERRGFVQAFDRYALHYMSDPGDPDQGIEPTYRVIPYVLFRPAPGFDQTITIHGAGFINGALDSEGANSPAQLTTPYTYYVTAVDADGKESGLSVGVEIDGPASNNWQAGDRIDLFWNAVPGAVSYRVYKASFSGRPGYIASVGGTTFSDNNVAPSLSEGAPKYVDPFVLEDENGNTVYDYPGAVCLFEQRLVFASTERRPQTIWMSKSGDYGNFAVYTPQADDSPIELTLASAEVSGTKWMVPLRSLIIGTTGVEWEISSSQGAFTAKTAHAKQQSFWGSSLSRAMVVGNIILHVNNTGSQVRNLQYDFAADSYGGIDLSVMAPHLFEDATVIDWAYQKAPDSIIWAVRGDGLLLGLTFQNEHQVSAWHWHDTAGQFKAVCSTPYDTEYTLFALVARDGKHFLERMAKRYTPKNNELPIFLDSSLSLRGSAGAVSGLTHLNGREVGVSANGVSLGTRVVSGGRVELGGTYTNITVGLLYTSDLETMPVEVAGQQGTSSTLKKYINAANVIMQDSGPVKVGVCAELGNFTHVRWQDVPMPARGGELFTGMRKVVAPVVAENFVSVCLRSETPVPVTVLGIVSRIAVNG